MPISLLLAFAVQAAAPTPAATLEKKTCRRAVATGSIMAKRTCHTAAEWAQIDAANRAYTQDALDARNARSMSTRQ